MLGHSVANANLVSAFANIVACVVAVNAIMVNLLLLLQQIQLLSLLSTVVKLILMPLGL